MQTSYIYSSCLGSEGSVKDQKSVIYGHCFLMHKAGKLSVHVVFSIESLGQIYVIHVFIFEPFSKIEGIMFVDMVFGTITGQKKCAYTAFH